MFFVSVRIGLSNPVIRPVLVRSGRFSNIDRPCNHFFHLFKMDVNDLKYILLIKCIYKNFAIITPEQRQTLVYYCVEPAKYLHDILI